MKLGQIMRWHCFDESFNIIHKERYKVMKTKELELLDLIFLTNTLIGKSRVYYIFINIYCCFQ